MDGPLEKEVVPEDTTKFDTVGVRRWELDA
jgi:hypothetical protein